MNDLVADKRGGVYFAMTGGGLFDANPQDVVSRYGADNPRGRTVRPSWKCHSARLTLSESTGKKPVANQNVSVAWSRARRGARMAVGASQVAPLSVYRYVC